MTGPEPQRVRGPDDLRLFVAVLLPEPWLTTLTDALRSLRDAGLRLRFVRPEGIHLTLKFLGATPPHKLTAIESAIARAASGSGAFDLVLAGLGTFGPAGRPRVVWAGVGGDRESLAGLQRTVDESLLGIGIPRERQPFNPHLTLARVPDALTAEEAHAIVTALSTMSFPATPAHRVRSLALMQSDLGSGGARYTRLNTWPIGDRSM